MKDKRSVCFEDPETGVIRYTSRRSADKDVARGVAQWQENSRTREMTLIYVSTDRRVIAAAANRARHLPRYQNGDGFAALEAIAGLPCIQPIKLLIGHRPASPPRDYPTVELSRQALILPQPVAVPWPA